MYFVQGPFSRVEARQQVQRATVIIVPLVKTLGGLNAVSWQCHRGAQLLLSQTLSASGMYRLS